MDYPELDLFETDFSVMEVLGRRGVAVSRHSSGQMLAPCPSCGQASWVLPTGMFCDAVDCRFTAGGPLEVLMATTGSRTFLDAVVAAEVMFPDKGHFWTGSDPSELKRRVASQAQSRRSLFEFFLRAPSEAAHSGAELLGEAVSHLVSHLSRQLSVFVLDASQTGRLVRFIQTLNPDENPGGFPLDKASAAIPLFRKHHEVGSVLLWSPEGGGRTKEMVVLPSRFSLSGLLNSTPGSEETFLFGDPVQALQWGRRISLSDARPSVMGVLVDPEASGGFLPHAPVYCPSDDEGPAVGAALRKSDPGVRFMLGDPPHGERLDWPGYVLSRLSASLETTGGFLPPADILFAQGAELSPEERGGLVHRLRANGFSLAARQLEEGFSTRVVLRTKGTSIVETPDGYHAVKDRQTMKETVSNFTLHFDRNIVFPDQLAVFHGGTVRFASKSYPVVMGAGDIETAAKCQTAVREAMLRLGVDMDALPTVHSASLFKGVASVLRESVASLPPSKGVASLGWSPDKKTFTTPQWQIGMDGFRDGPFDFHPTRVSLSFFESGPPRFSDVAPPDLPAGLADLCRLVLAGVHRAFSHLPMEGVPLEQTHASHAAVARMFGILGQKRAVNSHGLQPEGLGLWPVYGFGHDHGLLKTSSNFVFGFCERGFKLAGVDDDTEESLLDDAGAWLNYAVRRLCEHLLSDSRPRLERRRRALFFCELLEEGGLLLEGVFGGAAAKWPSAPESFAEMEGILEVASPSTLGQFFDYSYTSQKIRVHHSRTGADEKALSLELQKISGGLEMHDGYISVPSPAMYSVLRHYYGTEIHLPRAESSGVS